MRLSITTVICFGLGVMCGSSLLRAQSVTETDIYDCGDGPIGNHPQTGLIQASDGNLYGTMPNVESQTQFGSVYRVSPNGVVSVAHAFTNGVDGGQPQASLIEGPDGALYGTTSQGGSGYQAGTVFRLTLDGQLTTLFAFTGAANATAMNTTLTFGSDGTLYGVSSKGGPQYTGVLFKMSPQGQFTDLFNFVDSNFYDYPAGEFPETPLLEYSPGNFIGTTSEYGGSSPDNTGTIFTISSSGEYDEIYQFHDPNGAPSGFLTIASDNALYGIGGGQSGNNEGGIIYRVSAAGSYSTVHYLAQNTEGNGPNGLIVGSDGRLYTTTFSGGVNGTGTIVAVNKSGDVTVLHSFAAANINGNEDGDESLASLVQASDGAFYGTTASGGANLDGIIFRLALSPALPTFAQHANRRRRKARRAVMESRERILNHHAAVLRLRSKQPIRRRQLERVTTRRDFTWRIPRFGDHHAVGHRHIYLRTHLRRCRIRLRNFERHRLRKEVNNHQLPDRPQSDSLRRHSATFRHRLWSIRHPNRERHVFYRRSHSWLRAPAERQQQRTFSSEFVSRRHASSHSDLSG